MSPGKEVDLSPMFFTQTSHVDYDNLCKLDVLGLADSSTGDQAEVYAEFKEQLPQDAEGWYETGLVWRGNHPPLPSNKNQLWNVLVRARFHPVAIAGDIKQAFLQVRIREEDRDTLRFHWLKDLNSQIVETLRFTRALFGLTCSPFLLGGVVQNLLESCREKYPEIVSEIEKSYYVDDLIRGGPTQAKAETIKSATVEIFAKGTFELHKWHSNRKELKTACSQPDAKLSPLGGETSKPCYRTRSLAAHQEGIQAIELHAFGDTNGKGVSAAVYTIVVQENGVNQGLVASRARLAKKRLTIPRLELSSGHTAVNLLSNVSEASEGLPVTVKYCWLDSTVALHWIRCPGEYKQLVSNRVQKIQAHSDVVWHHVRTSDNRADVGSRSGDVTNHAL
ncbi:uncharacterized protein [Montipora foliosa]|uniref:uncharacterized protein n=1 Tax=Montipora foliosa TaxID=591990 RepID=UPI0035F202A1